MNVCWKKFLQMQDTTNNVDFFCKWLTVELAPTIYGEKPATLLNLMNTRKFPMKTLWLTHGQGLVANSNIKWLLLKEDDDSIKILFYHVELLSKFVTEYHNRCFLKNFGYHNGMKLEEVLEHFKERFQSICPHEMGILLGIPLKDVRGFIEANEECHTCQGMWKIYGDPTSSLCVMKRMEETKSQVADWMMAGQTVDDIVAGDRQWQQCS